MTRRRTMTDGTSIQTGILPLFIIGAALMQAQQST
jgi:hypothetical protein